MGGVTLPLFLGLGVCVVLAGCGADGPSAGERLAAMPEVQLVPPGAQRVGTPRVVERTNTLASHDDPAFVSIHLVTLEPGAVFEFYDAALTARGWQRYDVPRRISGYSRQAEWYQPETGVRIWIGELPQDGRMDAFLTTSLGPDVTAFSELVSEPDYVE